METLIVEDLVVLGGQGVPEGLFLVKKTVEVIIRIIHTCFPLI